jgi:hypothetical protein
VGPAWREAFDIAWLSRALSLALSRDPPAWRGWTRGLASAAAEAAAYSPPGIKLSPQQITHLLAEEDSFFTAATAGDTLRGGPELDLVQLGALLRPTIAFQWPPQPHPPPSHPQPAPAVPSTRVGDWPQWPFHDKERCPAPPDQAHFGFVAQVKLALVKECTLANATGILPRDGMLYFFVQKGSLHSNPENHDVNDLASFLLQPVQCCVVHYAGSSGDEWPLTSIHAVDARKFFSGVPLRAYTSTALASDVSLTAPPFAAHQIFMSPSGDDGSDAGSGYCSEMEGMAEDDYLKYASEAGPDRRAPLMLGHRVPPPWMAGARGGDYFDDGGGGDDEMMLSGYMMTKLRDVCYPQPVDAINAANTDAQPAALSDDTVPLLQFHVNHWLLGEYYLVFVVGKEDLLARRFDKVTAHVQFKIQ